MEPTPSGCGLGLDSQNNSFRSCWFDGLHTQLRITTMARVRTLRDNPFEYLLTPQAMTLPLDLPGHERQVLAPALELSRPRDVALDPIGVLARELLAMTGSSTLSFCSLLASRLHQDLDTVERPDPGVQPPEETLEKGAGACRDLAVLYMEVCRYAGLPARFVSGYQDDPEAEEGEPNRSAELHAWAEVFIPGGGWRGFDPSQGLAVADRHVPLAAALRPEQAAPVSGSFRGTGVVSTMEHEIRITTTAED